VIVLSLRYHLILFLLLYGTVVQEYHITLEGRVTVTSLKKILLN